MRKITQKSRKTESEAACKVQKINWSGAGCMGNVSTSWKDNKAKGKKERYESYSVPTVEMDEVSESGAASKSAS